MQFWKLKFGHKAKFCSDFEHKVWPRVWSWSSSETFETEVWSISCCWGLVRVWSKSLVERYWIWNLIKICVRTCFYGKQNSTLGSVVPLAMFTFFSFFKTLPPTEVSVLEHRTPYCDLGKDFLYLLICGFYFSLETRLRVSVTIVNCWYGLKFCKSSF